MPLILTIAIFLSIFIPVSPVSIDISFHDQCYYDHIVGFNACYQKIDSITLNFDSLHRLSVLVSSNPEDSCPHLTKSYRTSHFTYQFVNRLCNITESLQCPDLQLIIGQGDRTYLHTCTTRLGYCIVIESVRPLKGSFFRLGSSKYLTIGQDSYQQFELLVESHECSHYVHNISYLIPFIISVISLIVFITLFIVTRKRFIHLVKKINSHKSEPPTSAINSGLE